MKKTAIYLMILMLAGVFSACNNDDPGNNGLDNRLYLESSTRTTQLYVSTEDTYSQTLTAAITKPVNHDVNLRYKVDPKLVDVYNTNFSANAVILPLNHYLISSKKDVIKAGDVRSGSITIDFVDVLDLDKTVLYVLPISIVDADIPILHTRATNYYVFKGAKLVNIVGDMTENYCDVTWPNPSVVTGMNQITMECLVKSHWGEGTEANINSLMGIEGYFLLRTGNVGTPANQLQVCLHGTSGLPTGPLLPYDEWVHIAVTYDCTSCQCNIYINGVKSASSGKTNANLYSTGINLASSGVTYPDFHIGKSYDNSRWICGDIAECRIWNRVLTAEEIANPIHPYYVNPTSEGLVAYWKFNEATGKTVIDRTGNGNDAVALNPIVWQEVSLPE